MKTNCFAAPAIASALAAAAALAADWPQQGRDPQHTNFTPDSPAPPYAVAWAADFAPEQIYSAQPVIAGGRIFQTTLQGNLYALDEKTGERLWRYKAGDCMWSGASAGAAEYGGAGMVFVAAWEGLVCAVAAEDGREIWRFDAEAPISGAPCVAEETVFIGTRPGALLAIGMDGKLKWRTQLSWHMYSTAAWDAGRVFAATEDMRVHCLDAKSGTQVWQSEQLHGMVIREFYPVIHKGKVLLSVTPAVWMQDPGGPAPLLMPWGGWGMTAEELKAASAKYTPLLKAGEIPPEIEEAQQGLVEFYRTNPEYQTFYVLNASDGEQAYHAVHHYACVGLENLHQPPAVCADGRLAMMCVFDGAKAAVFDLDKNRWVNILVELGGAATDNVDYLSVGGNRIITKNWIRGGHGQTAGFVYDLSNRSVAAIGSGLPQPKRVSTEAAEWRPASAFSADRLLGMEGWGVAGVSPAPISGKRFYWIKNKSQILAYEEKGQ